MSILWLKIALPLCGIVGGVLVVVYHESRPQPLNQRQAAMVDSLTSAAPSSKDLK